MNKYYCYHCGNLFGEFEIIQGESRDVDDYTNAACPDCTSDDIRDIDDDELCPHCERYHEKSIRNGVPSGYDECAAELYSDYFGLRFVENDMYEAKLAMSYGDMTLREYVLHTPQEFVEFVCEAEKAELRETISLYERTGIQPEVLNRLKKYVERKGM